LKEKKKDFKMRNAKKLAIGLATVTLLTASLDARGFGGKHHHKGFSSSSETTSEVRVHKHRGFLSQVFEVTDLTTDQETEIYALLTAERETMKTLRENRILTAPLSAVLSVDGLDRDSFEENEASFHEEIASLKADTLEAVLATLTTVQLEELITLVEADEAEKIASLSSSEDNTTE
jgi:Spy/CpxP family protein refolding chaperone